MAVYVRGFLVFIANDKDLAPNRHHFTRQLIVLTCVAVLFGCGAQPLLKYSDREPPGIFSSIGSRGAVDDRARFREIFCSVTDARKGWYPDERPCGEALHNLDEGNRGPASTSITPNEPGSMKVVIVTGIFGECIADYLLPFSDGRYFEHYRPQTHGYEYLRALGYDDVEVIVTPGRSSTTANGVEVHKRLRSISAATSRDVVVIAYSKGVTDVLHALTLFPKIPPNIRAVVGVAGVVAGTPIADRLAGTYEMLLRKTPYKDCPPGDGGGVRSLSREEQFAWLSRHPLPESVRYYSLVAFAPSERITMVLKPFYAALSRTDPRNDGQLLIQDAVIPGSKILGYLNGDHWAVAIAFNRSDTPSWRRLIDHNSFPREVLMESILQYLARELGTPTRGGAGYPQEVNRVNH